MVDVRIPAFGHGQLCVALSHAARIADLRVLCATADVKQHADGPYFSTINVLERRLLEDAVLQPLQVAFWNVMPVSKGCLLYTSPSPRDS